MRKVRMFVWADGVVSTGFSRVMHSILENLPKDVYDIYWLAVNYFGDPHTYPYKIFPASSKGDIYGLNRVQEILSIAKPDIIFALNDPWILNTFLEVVEKCYENGVFPPTVIYFPADAQYHDPEWYTRFDKVFPVVYSEFGLSVASQARPDLNFSVIPHGVDFSKFYRMADKAEARRLVFSKEPDRYKDSFIVLNANRNQPRKRIDLTIKGFAEFAKGKDNVNLYMHSGVVDSHINQAILARRLGIQDKLILSTTKSGAQQVPVERLNLIYNATDVGINTSLGEGWGLCLNENTPIWTAEGIFRIKEVEKGMHVFSHTGNIREVLDVIKTGKKPLLRFNTDMMRVLECSPDHILMTDSGWKKASEVTTSDYLEFVKPNLLDEPIVIDLANSKLFFCNDTSVWYKNRKPGDFKVFSRFINLDVELYELIANYISRGYIKKSRAIIPVRNATVAETVHNQLLSIGVPASIDYTTNPKFVLVSFVSDFWVRYLESTFGKRFKDKRVPQEFLENYLPNITKSLILSKFRSIEDRVFFHMTGINISSFVCAQLYAENIPISAKIKYIGKLSGCTEFTRKNFSEIKSKIKKPKHFRVIEKNGKLYTRVISIKTTEPVETYDLNVEVDHSYTANGIIVHNCNVEHAVTGAPQIVPNHSTCKELFHDCGILIPVERDETLADIMTEGGIVSPESVAECLEKIYRNKQLYRELSEKSYKKFNNKALSWSSIGSIWNQIFMGIITQYPEILGEKDDNIVADRH